ncbi:MAG TPA: TetR/AcrR family transcriptional regulator [Acidimicrobiales bacterium]|nr:TetR/AcrR family transcriptional regulator [Acidimicrobiales bacterium]
MRDTRAELLDAGVRLYGSMAAELLRGLTAGAVAKEAGFHRQTFYRYWETQGQYVQELLRHVLGTEATPTADGATQLAQRQPPADLEAFVRDLIAHDFARLVEDHGSRMRISLLVTDALQQPPFDDLLHEFYETSLQRLLPAYEELLAGLGREPVAPVTTRELVRILQALLVGMVLQSNAAADDEPRPSALLEWGVLTLLEGLTEPVDDARTA